MRLLNCGTDGVFGLTSFDEERLPPYAILSHTWGANWEEVTYQDVITGAGQEKQGYAKLRFCKEQAEKDGLAYFWVDTCCINKATSDELASAINSMFRWYQNAAKCYVYLSDVSVPPSIDDPQLYRITWGAPFRRSRWFTRGWTVQELVAPAHVEFYSREGRLLGSKMSLEQEVHEVSQIPINVLRGQRLSDISFEERKGWVAKRETSIKEDKAYCLLGIFGVFLPLIYGEGEFHAFQRLDEEVQKVTARGRPVPTAKSVLPFPRNTRFVGREAYLQRIERMLLPLRNNRRVSIYGLGGSGKTALALEFAYRTMATYPGCQVFWVPAMSRESFELAYRDIGIALRIPGITDDNADVKELVREALAREGSSEWLMIVDNADDTQVLTGSAEDGSTTRLMDFLPRSERGAILFTTRGRKAAHALTDSDVLKLDSLNETQARELMAQRIVNKELLADEDAVDKLLVSLTNLPLAIVQAAAYINSNDISVADYVSLFQNPDSETELFSEQFEDPNRYREMESTIARTWYISFDQIRRQDPLAASFLSFIACVDRINIPESLLPDEGSRLERIKAIGTLTGYAFLAERRQDTSQAQSQKFFDVHRLVQMASICWLKEHGEWTTIVERATSRIQQLVPEGYHTNRKEWDHYLPHAIHLSVSQNVLSDELQADLLDRVANCQHTLGQYARAEVTQRQVLMLRERTLGSKHWKTLECMGDVGRMLEAQGKYEAALEMHGRTLAMREEMLGEEDMQTLRSLRQVAYVLERQGKYAEGEAVSRQALERAREVLGPDHRQTLTSMGELAYVLNRQGKHEEAEKLSRHATSRLEEKLGFEHSDVLLSVGELACILDDQGKHQEAEMLYRRVLAQSEKLVGPEHRDTLAHMGNLAYVLENQGKYEEAESIYWNVLATREKVFGPDHRATLTCVFCLGSLLEKQHRYEESAAMYERACAGYSLVLGENHPTTRRCRRYYAEMLASQS